MNFFLVIKIFPGFYTHHTSVWLVVLFFFGGVILLECVVLSTRVMCVFVFRF